MADATEVRRCSFCVMDTTVPGLVFDSEGRCDRCRALVAIRGREWFVDDSGAALLEASLAHLRDTGNSEYSCVLGVSGGVDSSYLALKLHDWGVRPLVVHIDAGWNSELAVKNIERILDHTGWELHTHVVNWNDMRRLQLAYLRAGVSNQDVPQDHAFFAALYHFATAHGIRHVISGGNFASEGIGPAGWHHSAMDSKNIKAIWKAFGDGDLQDYPTISFAQYYLWYPRVKRMTTVRPLNWIPYNGDDAVAELEARIGYRRYERKHGESIFTKYFQNHYLPTRFGYDMRKPHLSSLIVSGQRSRDQALRELDEPLYDRDELARDERYLIRKLRISESEFQALMGAPTRDAREFPNWDREWRLAKSTQARMERLLGRRLNVYS